MTLGSSYTAPALDSTYLEGLGTRDVVHSWGLLHHTRAMWNAIGVVSDRVAPGGLLGLAIYNDQDCGAGSSTLVDLRHLRPGRSWREYGCDRGMSAWHDFVDWVGGYRFEVAKPEEVFGFCRARGFTLERLITRQGRGCNEFCFRRGPVPEHA
jgi:hypothetical protein